MKLLPFFLLILPFTQKTFGQKGESHSFKTFTIDTTLNFRLAKAKSTSKFGNLMIDDGFWLLMTKKHFEEDFGNVDPIKFFDTLQTLSEVVCDCMIKKDTIYVQGGIAYAAGAGFDLKIVDNSFNGRIWASGKNYWTNDSLNIKEEILLNSNTQSLKIQSRSSLKLGRKLVGELVLESEDFFEKNGGTANRFYLKLLFGCKLDEAIVF